MKTAVVPNDADLDTLMQLSAELGAVMADYEDHLIDHATNRLVACAHNTYNALTKVVGPVSPEDATKLKGVVTFAVMTAAAETNTFNHLIEMAKCTHSSESPSELIHKALDQTKDSLFHWSSVNG